MLALWSNADRAGRRNIRKFFCSALLAYCVAESQNTFELALPFSHLKKTSYISVWISLLQSLGQHIIPNSGNNKY